MDYLWILLGLIILLGGIAGCFLPVIPGPFLGYVSLLLLQLTSTPPFSLEFMLWFGAGTLVITLIDYLIPPLAAKKFGGSRYSVMGSVIGVIAGLFIFPPWGILIFPFAGAYIGEIMFGSERAVAKKAAVGAALGLMSGILLKLSFTLVMSYFFFTNAPWY